MKKEELVALGLTEEQADKVLELKGKVVTAEQTKAGVALAVVEKQRDDLQTQLDGVQEQLKAFEGVDVGELKGKVKTLEEGLQEAQDTYAQDVAKLKRETETKEFLSGLKFINSETREYYAAKLEAALDDKENVGKSRKELMDTLTLDADGKQKLNVFEAEKVENPNEMILPPSGDILDEPPKKTPPRII